MATKVIAFGEVMMRLATPNCLKLQQTSTLHVTYTGTGVNVLSALSQYGYNTSLVTKLPNNSIGQAAVAHIHSLGIGAEHIVHGGEYIGKYFLETGFDVRPTKVTYSNRTESSFCTSEINDFDLDEIFSEAKIIHLCGITLAISDETRKLILHIAQAAKERGVTVVFDCNYRPKLWNNEYNEARKWYKRLLPFVDLCLMTDRDAQFVLGMETKYTETNEKLQDLLPRVAHKYNISHIAGTIRNIKPGESRQSMKGFICFNSDLYYSKLYTFSVLDRIGAGDGFASGIIYGYDQQLSNEDTIQFATAAGVLAHTTYGDSPVSTAEDIWELVENNDIEVER